LVLVLLAVAIYALRASADASSPLLATVSGTVFHDQNANGERDEGEEGLLGRAIVLLADGQPVKVTTSGFSGEYTISFQPDQGELAVTVRMEEEAPILCSHSGGSHNPRSRDEPPLSCWGGELIPWHVTTQEVVPLEIEAGGQAVVDFGGRRWDAITVSGLAFAAGARAPGATRVEALVGEIECGNTSVELVAPRFEIIVLGAGEREGCASPGETVRFQVGGLPALETLVWDPAVKSRDMDLTAMPGHAWYWVDRPAAEAWGSLGATVQASVDGLVCGEAQVSQAGFGFSPLPPPIGFSRLVVASTEIQGGCGGPGTEVEFLIDGAPAGVSVAWAPGIHYLDLPLPGAVLMGDAGCDFQIESVDALFALRKVAGTAPLVLKCPPLVDVDCDGAVTAVDGLLILRFVAVLPADNGADCRDIGT
jgi:hypothetical protein